MKGKAKRKSKGINRETESVERENDSRWVFDGSAPLGFFEGVDWVLNSYI